MSSKPLEVSYNQTFQPLDDILQKLERPGEFATSGTHETPMPSLQIEGVGLLSFPVPPQQAAEVIQHAAERAPYGRGSQTLVDESVRKVWQIAPDKVRLGGRGWSKAFALLVERVATELGCTSEDVSAEFYKLLVYETGGFFLAHRDSEKLPGMFGTLVVTLPSAHEGGQLFVRHAGREMEFNLIGTDPGEVHFAAFYADCEHEVTPITAGYRMCLVFNLIHCAEAKKAEPAVPDDRTAIQQAAAILKKWKRAEAPAKLVYLLDHHYTPAGLSFAALKNSDAARAAVLRAAAHEADCDLHLAIVHIEDSGLAEYSGGRYYGRGRYQDDDDDYEIGEVCDSDQYLGDFRTSEDVPVSYGKMPLGEDELLPVGALDDEEPDEVHFSEATGNAGAEFERTYLRAALVLWPSSRSDEVCLSAGLAAGVARLGTLVEAVQTSPTSDHKSHAIQAIKLADLIIDRWVAGATPPVVMSHFLRHVARLSDAKLATRVLSGPALQSYDGTQNAAMLEAIAQVPAPKAAAVLCECFTQNAQILPAPCMDLWVRLAASPAAGKAGIKSTATALIDPLASAAPKDKLRYRYWPELEESEKQSDPAPMLDAPLTLAFLRAISEHDLPSQLEAAVAAITRNPAFFDPDSTLVPMLELVAGEAGEAHLPDAPRRTLWDHCADHYLRRSQHPPTPPENWALTVDASDSTSEGKALIAFARDPETREARFPLAKARRQHLHRFIETHHLDMDHVTEHKGSPHTLVCTKNRATYKKACARHKKDIALMKRLSRLANSGSPASSDRLASLVTAFKNAAHMVEQRGS